MESARTYRSRSVTVKRERIREYRQEYEGGFFDSMMMESQTSDGKEDDRGIEVEAQKEGTGKFRFPHYRVREINAAPSKLGMGSGNVAEDLRQITLRTIFLLLFANRRGVRERWSLGNYDSLGDEGASANSVNQGEMTGRKDGRWNISRQGYFAEEEHASFAAKGCVKTSDGREINFNIDLSMSRRFESVFREEVSQVKKAMKDPLVINYDAPAAQVSDQKFYFDLDADGKKEEVSMLAGGSAFLALDLNGDGKVNDGSELFGTGQEDGFSALAKYDQDGNGWIDEGDEVWSRLRLWAKDGTGRDILYSLSEKNIGAICLGSVGTDFSLLGQNGGTEGMIRRTGICLYESGLAGTVQHLDLATYQKEA